MTQAFNLGLLANKVNSSGQLDGPTGITGAVPTATNVAGSGITGSQSIPKNTLPTGSVLQVVNATFNTQTTTSSTSFVSTYLTASITPSSSTSKVLVLMSNTSAISNTSYVGVATIYRGATNLGNGNGGITFSGTAQDNSMFMQVLDSPATTSSTTYTVYGRADSGGTASYGNSARVSTITLMEIAA